MKRGINYSKSAAVLAKQTTAHYYRAASIAKLNAFQVTTRRWTDGSHYVVT